VPDTEFPGPAAAILRAVSDPGSIAPRLTGHPDGLEPRPDWQLRAVLTAASPWLLQAGESERFQVREARDTLAQWDCDRGVGGAFGGHDTERALAGHLRAMLALIPAEATDGP
jgi:hypothetical protein